MGILEEMWQTEFGKRDIWCLLNVTMYVTVYYAHRESYIYGEKIIWDWETMNMYVLVHLGYYNKYPKYKQ